MPGPLHALLAGPMTDAMGRTNVCVRPPFPPGQRTGHPLAERQQTGEPGRIISGGVSVVMVFSTLDRRRHWDIWITSCCYMCFFVFVVDVKKAFGSD